MGWTDWNYINVVCMVTSGMLAGYFFSENNTIGGWFNLFASAVNLAIVGVRLV